jgi:hypothetical protein
MMLRPVSWHAQRFGIAFFFARLDFLDWGWQRYGLVPAMPGHHFCLLYR